ncbi:unnamed protein product (macronuclear) [Paramecium tetraurelia]|uniref:Transmembrane protein n=1 Tax=Paramecium tetraurelia TaxID=5888 RepID=A0E0R5_PARTE|nr:uncharacterized protein GSPATT00022050001 [Paramecium tetraurelia]CAK88882.1 unnamed protein product [Paramecium tetraurelia]|eukprot:XP_001456279.1 hypothetical protein (macronuclear) [Paramecium tetraurelia strain d4-2]
MTKISFTQNKTPQMQANICQSLHQYIQSTSQQYLLYIFIIIHFVYGLWPNYILDKYLYRLLHIQYNPIFVDQCIFFFYKSKIHIFIYTEPLRRQLIVKDQFSKYKIVKNEFIRGCKIYKEIIRKKQLKQQVFYSSKIRGAIFKILRVEGTLKLDKTLHSIKYNLTFKEINLYLLNQLASQLFRQDFGISNMFSEYIVSLILNYLAYAILGDLSQFYELSVKLGIRISNSFFILFLILQALLEITNLLYLINFKYRDSTLQNLLSYLKVLFRVYAIIHTKKRLQSQKRSTQLQTNSIMSRIMNINQQYSLYRWRFRIIHHNQHIRSFKKKIINKKEYQQNWS